MYNMLILHHVLVIVANTEYEQELEKNNKLDLYRIVDSDEEWERKASKTQKRLPPQQVSNSDFDSSINELYPRKMPVANETASPSEAEEIAKKAEELESMKNKLNEALDTDGNISGLTDKNMWEKLHNYLVLNYPDFNIDGNLGIQLHIRYFLCCYIVAFIPAEFVFFFPAMYNKMIPKKVYKIEILGDALKEMETFLKFVRKESETSFVVNFFIGRKNSVKEDIRFLLDVPDKILSDPVFILRELLGFEIKAKGYKKYKKNNLQ